MWIFLYVHNAVAVPSTKLVILCCCWSFLSTIESLSVSFLCSLNMQRLLLRWSYAFCPEVYALRHSHSGLSSSITFSKEMFLNNHHIKKQGPLSLSCSLVICAVCHHSRFKYRESGMWLAMLIALHPGSEEGIMCSNKQL